MAVHKIQDVNIYNADNVQSNQNNAAIQKILTKTAESEGNRGLF